MAVKKHKPTSAGRRYVITSDFSNLTKKRPEKSLTSSINKKGGRNNAGRITIRFRGGGHKRLYREIDFKRKILDVPAKVIALEYDPNRRARIALVEYPDKTKSYIIAPKNLHVGEELISSRGDNVEIKIGNCMRLKNVPLGTMIHNIELETGKGGKIVRSAGASAQITAKEGNFAHVKLPSGEVRLIKIACCATLGQVSNADWKEIKLGKAGRSAWLGRKSNIRGVAMNPVDHPHGGGEGKAGQGNPHPSTPWGKPTKGYKTRKPNRYSDKYIAKRRK